MILTTSYSDVNVGELYMLKIDFDVDVDALEVDVESGEVVD